MATKQNTKSEVTQEPKSQGEVVPATGALRLSYPKALAAEYDIGVRAWKVLIDAVWPGARSIEAVCMAVSYCKERKLDPFKKPVHIVPVYNTKLKKYVETIWPGISELRTTAFRTSTYAGKDAMEEGPMIDRTFRHKDDRGEKEYTMKFHEWMRLTVYRVVNGQRCAFVGPKVYWLEAYATAGHDSEIPNAMWKDRRNGQLDKCAEAAALRAAFPEELGGLISAEEMEGRTVDSGGFLENSDEIIPPRPQISEFDRKPDEEKKPEHENVTDYVTEGGPQNVVWSEQSNPEDWSSSLDAQEAVLDDLFKRLREAKTPADVAGLREEARVQLVGDTSGVLSTFEGKADERTREIISAKKSQ